MAKRWAWILAVAAVMLIPAADSGGADDVVIATAILVFDLPHGCTRSGSMEVTGILMKESPLREMETVVCEVDGGLFSWWTVGIFIGPEETGGPYFRPTQEWRQVQR